MAGVAYSYDLSTLVGGVRFYAADTDPTGLNQTGGDRTRTDSEILFLLVQNGNDIHAAAAELLESRAAEYTQDAVKTAQGQLRQDFTTRSSRCLEAAKALRAGIASPLTQTVSLAPFSNTAADGTPGTMDAW